MSAKFDDPVMGEQTYAGDVHRPMDIRAMMTMIDYLMPQAREVSVSAALLLGLANAELSGLLALQTDPDVVDLAERRRRH
ncbi:hypothetical protein CXZ10_06950 [Pleomorphomonas diazotrophica]|uniref:Uncharacterized protein n=1 Tax=Pleomorphomonas diazotrophica TaxID=1166257 RepID=A0A1I4S6K3_9HYPH|nr:hypothetical protein [Pleomorphomonas diazotrophica]PKR89911.1 hypothetical protein CXZ10_06950 [Pleomorphomonas diazotrophica]SFM60112.1 hypothetical protein SAMN05192571_10382 [Pleomorphomonas diazotrophica]